MTQKWTLFQDERCLYDVNEKRGGHAFVYFTSPA
jgi:hypothetical protein